VLVGLGVAVGVRVTVVGEFAGVGVLARERTGVDVPVGVDPGARPDAVERAGIRHSYRLLDSFISGICRASSTRNDSRCSPAGNSERRTQCSVVALTARAGKVGARRRVPSARTATWNKPEGRSPTLRTSTQ